ncbi:2-amino-4-hydroxy-6-hydroxymethyldihydropteridine diphosphokinase [Mycolicibacterium sp. F2034L]|uniref:2-amino-4-hydroxy-6- hydroxymethyldihydropteridine diphosphokinase n=1 Tax=Mycolicibacterium sp. F2034L TaxID=2926422 RepID=UPI001FF5992F|nr:2-amino-4-hydroxy-6-hydroxymethyldihydropteridine diphosphokinase [Mycolicibacterium sp. F2034L]MCK0176913.1 2-amino-4-hydroxy-6-hydroxymethyldihydropteridine diphosphokinase [Mycolicibacterium sp. F2034L]
MSRVVLSIGSNVGDRMARLQSVVDGIEARIGAGVVAVSPIYETEAWGGVDQGSFLNAVLIAEDPDLDCHGWLRFGQELERAADRVREQRWGPRTLDVDIVTCHDAAGEIRCESADLTLPHPYAHLRAFVLVPWIAVDPTATLTVGETTRTVALWLEELDPVERSGVALTGLALRADAVMD